MSQRIGVGSGIANDVFHRQSGAILVTGMVFLVLITMLVLSALRSGTLEERMATNARNRQVALQAAEAVLSEAEERWFTSEPEFLSKFDSADLTAGFYLKANDGSQPKWRGESNWSTSGSNTFESLSLSGVESQPRYMIEITERPLPDRSLGCSSGLAQITARGTGRDSSVVFVQSVVRFRADKC